MKKKGFTLVELLAVIVILAIILAIAIPSITSVINNSTKNAFESDAKMVLNAIRLKTLENASFDPTTINETNITALLGINNTNYKDVSVTKAGTETAVLIVGQNKWNDMVVSGTKDTIQVYDGVIVWLDADDTRSYPGTGNTWYDLSGNDNNATKNGNASNPVWNAGGYWTFPATALGVNGGMLIANSTTLAAVSNMTVELVFSLQTKALTGDDDWMCLFSKSIATTNQTPAISINQGATSNRYLHVERPSQFNSTTDLFTNYTGNQWYYVTVVLSSTSYGYINGTQVSTSTGGITANTNPIYLGLDYDSEMFKGKLAMVRVYDRALSATEVQQNFNALRSKFGL